MSDIRITATASLSTLNRWIQTIAGNLTGAQIYGYKGTRLSFGDALVDSIRDGAGSGALGGANAIQVPSGSITIGASSTDFRQGAIVSTGNDHHLAIDGNGWFAVTNPAGQITYTRNGEFHVDDTGNLVDAMGNFVLGVFDQSKGLVLNDGKSFIEPGTDPVTAVNFAGPAQVQIGSGNGVGQIPVPWQTSESVTVFGKTVAAGYIDTIATGLASTAAIATDAYGNLLVANSSGTNGRLRVVPAADGTYYGQAMTVGNVYVIAGNGPGVDGSKAETAVVQNISGVTVDHQGNVLIAQGQTHTLRFIPQADGIYFNQVMTAGHIYTIAGTGAAGSGGNDVAAISTQLNNPTQIVVDGDGHVLFAEYGSKRIRLLATKDGTYYGQAMTAGNLYTVAGGGAGGSGSKATQANIGSPYTFDIDAVGNLLIAGDGRLWAVAKTDGIFYGQTMKAGHLYTIAGTGSAIFNGDGKPALETNVEVRRLVKVDPFGHVFMDDRTNPRFRLLATRDGYFYGQLMKAGHVYTVAGNGVSGTSGDGGPARDATISTAGSLSFDGFGNMLFANSPRIRMIAPDHGHFGHDHGLYTFLDQPAAGYQDRNLATHYMMSGQIFSNGQAVGTDMPLMTLRTVDGSEVPITISLSATNNKSTNTAYDNARLIADAINAKSNLTGVGVSIVRDRKDPNGKVALVMGHINRTLTEEFIDFTDPYSPVADLARTGAGLTKVTIDAQGNVFHTVNVKTLTASAPTYRPEAGDKITFDATGQMINLSRGAEPGTAPPFATGVHVALIKPSNANGLEKTAGSSRFTYTDAAGRLMVGYAGQTKTSQIDHRFGFQIVGSSTIGAENRLTPQALEAANTSITDQLPELTIAQKVFSSTSKLVSVGNTIVDDLNGLIR